MERLLREEMRTIAIQTRDRLELTQKKMAEKLFMSESSYSDIETGRSGASALTSVLLLSMQDNASYHIQALKNKFDSLYEQEISFK